MKILNVLWQSGQLASLAWSTSDGFAVEVGKGPFCRWNDDAIRIYNYEVCILTT